MEKFINKINGNDTKLDLLTFLKIRKISIEQFLLENNVTTLASLDIFLSQLETSDFNASGVFKDEAKQIIHTLNVHKNKEQTIEPEIVKEEVVTKVNKKKKSETNNDTSS